MVSKKLLIKAVRTHKGSQTRVGKSIEVMAVTSYDSALNGVDGLRRRVNSSKNSSSGRGGKPKSSGSDFTTSRRSDTTNLRTEKGKAEKEVIFAAAFLETICILWLEVPTVSRCFAFLLGSISFLLFPCSCILLIFCYTQTLRTKLHEVGSTRYYDVATLWNTIEPFTRMRLDSLHFRLLCEILPLMAISDPPAFKADCLEKTVTFFVTACTGRVVGDHCEYISRSYSRAAETR